MRGPASMLILSALFGAGGALAAQESAGGLEARVWLDRGGEEPVLRRGENVRIYYRANEDAFAAIFRIDTDGRVDLLYPQHPGASAVVRGGRDYRLLPLDGSTWGVDEDPGMGYLFIVASSEPLDFSLFPFDERYGWDLGAVGEAVYTDPYVAIDDYVAAIVPAWETVPYALDFLSYSVGDTYSYPRFLCYDCHTAQRFASWNPYDYNCATYRVVIWDDPYFYPRYRYSTVNVNVVYAWPARALPRYEVTRSVAGDAVAPIVRVRTPAQREATYREAAYKESPVGMAPRTGAPVRRSVTSAPTVASASAAVPGTSGSRTSAEPTRRSGVAPLASPQERGAARAAPQQVPDTARSRPTLQRRPSARLPVRTPPSARATPPEASEPKDVTPAPTRTAPRAPITRPQRVPPSAPSARPSTEREPQAAPTPSRPSNGRAPATRSAPTRPSTGSTPSTRSTPTRATPQPSTSVRPQTTPRSTAPSAGSGSSRPSMSRPSVSRPSVSRPSASPAPARPRETPSARPSGPSRSSGPRPAEPRSSEPRPTVRSLPQEPSPRN